MVVLYPNLNEAHTTCNGLELSEVSIVELDNWLLKILHSLTKAQNEKAITYTKFLFRSDFYTNA